MPSPAKTPTFVLMPGLNGTAGSFVDFVAAAPPQCATLALTYPADERLGYAELTDWVCTRLADVPGPLVLLGESFSAPLSLLVANRQGQRVMAVVLVATFVLPPRAGPVGWLPWRTGFALTRPLYALRGWLAGDLATARIIAINSAELQKVAPAVLAHRVRQTLAVDATDALRQCTCPLLYLQAAHDLVVPASALARIRRIAPDIQVAVLPTQHYLLQAAPAQAWAVIRRFLAQLPG
ncbi:Alpha/beta hydrolase family protein [Andreprevotia lacus DSM 23236]|jgi:pimeloyl-ACP methyl ester carboxylesterase|uniref:Alpha/beta hydrolase family protein n=1 Tax=Andreprevotia lacus DSM 23236 TaxID=1121001 RepID=A0A1W1XVS3_9NEIS|nr:alpha/beta hydrolase [Andreprevotia lacus]SMC27955.1 Alpha/beta hydrolase family protein [Andreprevotia lacus DSM 23236]